MANPLFSLLGGGNVMPPAFNSLVQQFQQFKSTFRGNPQEQVQRMLNSGQITQAQYNKAVQMANALKDVLK